MSDSSWTDDDGSDLGSGGDPDLAAGLPGYSQNSALPGMTGKPSELTGPPPPELAESGQPDDPGQDGFSSAMDPAHVSALATAGTGLPSGALTGLSHAAAEHPALDLTFRPWQQDTVISSAISTASSVITGKSGDAVASLWSGTGELAGRPVQTPDQASTWVDPTPGQALPPDTAHIIFTAST